jgi:transposase
VERIVERAAGLDVHKDVIVAEAHLPGGVVEQGRFVTTTLGLVVLRDWLVGLGVTRVGVESTDVIRGSNKFLPPFSRSWPLRTRP